MSVALLGAQLPSSAYRVITILLGFMRVIGAMERKIILNILKKIVLIILITRLKVKEP